MEKVAFLFPGQGAQHIGMSRSLCQEYDIARLTFEEANDVLGYDLEKICFEGPLGDLGRIEHSLPGLLTSSVAQFRVYMQEIGVQPHMCCGHSLGEYSALTCSGAILFKDALSIVRKRSILAKECAEKGGSSMTVVDRISESLLEEACSNAGDAEDISISCYNAENQFTISGKDECIRKVEEIVFQNDGEVTPLFGSAPFHSYSMMDVRDGLEEEFKKYDFYNTRWPVLSNVTGSWHGGPDEIKGMLLEQLIKPVQWVKSMKMLKRFGITMTIEFGGVNVLGSFIEGGIRTFNYNSKKDRQSIKSEFKNESAYIKHIPTVITKCLKAAVATENNCRDTEKYDMGVIKPFEKIQSIQYEIQEKKSAPSPEQMRESLKLLNEIFITKEVPEKEQKEWYMEIIQDTGCNYLFPEYGKI